MGQKFIREPNLMLVKKDVQEVRGLTVSLFNYILHFLGPHLALQSREEEGGVRYQRSEVPLVKRW